MFRRYRRLLAVAMTCIVAFAGTVTAAHACALASAAPPAVASAAEAMPDCVETAPAADTAANACEAHCVAGQSLEPQGLAPVVLVAPQPALRIEVVDRSVHATLARPKLRPLDAAPPPLVRFTRLLN